LIWSLDLSNREEAMAETVSWNEQKDKNNGYNEYCLGFCSSRDQTVRFACH
jgi:hypothetical protein